MLNHHVPSRTMTFWRPLSHFQTEPHIKLIQINYWYYIPKTSHHISVKFPIILETWPFSEPLGLGRDVQVRGTTPKRSHTFHMAAVHGVRRQNGWLVCDALRMGYLALPRQYPAKTPEIEFQMIWSQKSRDSWLFKADVPGAQTGTGGQILTRMS